MINKKVKQISSILILSAILSTSTVFAENIETLKENHTDIQRKLEEKKSEIKETKDDTKNVGDQIEKLDKESNGVSKELSEIEADLVSLQVEIDKNTEELIVAEKVLSDKQENFEDRIKVMYMNGGEISYLELLLTSKDIKDFFSKRDMIQIIAAKDNEMIKSMREQKDIIKEKENLLTSQRSSISTVRNKIKLKRDVLDKVTREKQVLMDNLEKDVVLYESEYDKLNDFASELNSKIIELQEEQRLREEAEIRAKAASIAEAERLLTEYRSSSSGDYVSSSVNGKMAWPVPGVSRISSQFGYRIHPIFHTKKLHTGIDIPAPQGHNVISAENGVVIKSGWLGGYGNTIMIDHGGGVVTLYGHNSSLVANVGQTVQRGDVIAKIGSTGNSTGPHSHFEVRVNGDYVNPLSWLR